MKDLRTIYYIAKTELQTLFYSPIAWLIIIILIFQAGMIFTGHFEGAVRVQSMLNRDFSDITSSIFGGDSGLFVRILSSLYLYIPLLTMGLMSREYSTGSVKLLYNAPITNRQIVLGKYLSMVIFGLISVGLLGVFVLFTASFVAHFDWGLCLAGLLGIYLLILVYAAIGLFMSSLTSYQLVAAICTLSVLAVLNYIGQVWQDMDFVRDLTYWLSISGRAQKFIQGLICSEDVLYFLMLIVLFLAWTIIQLQAARQKSRWFVTWSKFAMLFAGVMLIGYLTSRPKLMFFFDATQTKTQSLVPETQQLIRQLKGGLTVTTYGNLMADDFGYVSSRHINMDLDHLRPYIRYKPEMETRYVYYYPKGTPESEVNFNMEFQVESKRSKFHASDDLDFPVDSLAGGLTIFRVFERENGQREILPTYNDANKFPAEEQYMALFRRFLEKAPEVGFLTGHGERNIYKPGDRDYMRISTHLGSRQSLVNLGLDPVEVNLQQPIPDNMKILVIADMRGELTPLEKGHLQDYIERGGNLLLMVKPRRSADIDSLGMALGVRFVPGTLVQPNENMSADIIFSSGIPEAEEQLSGMLPNMMEWRSFIAGQGCCGLEFIPGRGFEGIPLFVTSASGVWNEVENSNFVDDSLRLNPRVGEIEQPYLTGLALMRTVNNRQQKILVFGNADYFSNAGITFKAEEEVENAELLLSSFHWLTDGYVPLHADRSLAPDVRIDISRNASRWTGFIFMGVYPGILLLLAIGLWFRRKGK